MKSGRIGRKLLALCVCWVEVRKLRGCSGFRRYEMNLKSVCLWKWEEGKRKEGGKTRWLNGQWYGFRHYFDSLPLNVAHTSLIHCILSPHLLFAQAKWNSFPTKAPVQWWFSVRSLATTKSKKKKNQGMLVFIVSISLWSFLNCNWIDLPHFHLHMNADQTTFATVTFFFFFLFCG